MERDVVCAGNDDELFGEESGSLTVILLARFVTDDRHFDFLQIAHY